MSGSLPHPDFRKCHVPRGPGHEDEVARDHRAGVSDVRLKGGARADIPSGHDGIDEKDSDRPSGREKGIRSVGGKDRMSEVRVLGFVGTEMIQMEV